MYFSVSQMLPISGQIGNYLSHGIYGIEVVGADSPLFKVSNTLEFIEDEDKPRSTPAKLSLKTAFACA